MRLWTGLILSMVKSNIPPIGRTFFFFGTLLLPTALFAASKFCTGETEVCSFSQFRSSNVWLVQMGLALGIIAYAVVFFVQFAGQFMNNQFEGAAFYAFLKDKLRALALIAGSLFLVINLPSVLEVLHINGDIIKIIKTFTGL